MSEAFDVYVQLVQTPEVPELGPGPRDGVRTMAQLKTSFREVAGKVSLASPAQELVQALILLWHDHLEPAHGIAQAVETPDGSYVHAILHRREPDYSNAKYWFRRVGAHPAYRLLAEQARPLLERPMNHALCPGGEWDSFAFVDACERAERTKSQERDILRSIQAIEFKVLLGTLCGYPTSPIHVA